MNFEGVLTTEGPEYSFAAALRRQHERHRLRLPGAAGRSSTRSRRARRSSRARWPSTTACTRSSPGLLVRGGRGDRRRDPGRRPDDQDDDDLRLHERRRPALRRDDRGRRARRHERRPRRGRRDRQLADRQVRARGQDPRGLHLRGPRADRGGGGDPPRDVPRRAHRLAAVRPAHGGRERDRGARREARAGAAVLRRDAERVPQLHAGRPLGRVPDRGRRQDVQRARGALQQLPHAEVRARPRHLLGRRSPTTGCRSSRPTTRSSASRTASRRWARPSTPCRRARPRSRLRIPLLYSEGVAKGRISAEPLGRAHLDEPGEAHGHVAAQGRSSRRAPTPTSSSSTPSGAGPSTGASCT